VIPNGIDLSFYSPRPDREERQCFQVLYLGNMIEGKGYLEVLDTASALRRDPRRVNFSFVGAFEDDPARRNFLDRVEQLKLTDTVRLHGVLTGEEKLNVLRRSDVLVFPPKHAEGQPLVILEAMAVGLPIITTDRGAIAETVLHGVNGFVLPDCSSIAIAQRIRELRDNSELRCRMGSASRALAANYSLELFCSRLLGVFHEAKVG